MRMQHHAPRRGTVRSATCTLGLALTLGSGCLLLGDPPPLVDQCVDMEIGDAVGPMLAEARLNTSANTYNCPPETDFGTYPADQTDVVLAWTAPADGHYQFSVATEDEDQIVRLGITSPTCGGELEQCPQGSEGQIRHALAGEVLHLVVEGRTYDDEVFTVSIVPAGSAPECDPPSGDACDEPEDPPMCPDGSDPPCGMGTCPWQNDGECDEPEGTGVCPEGSDPADCEMGTCPWQNDGVCDEPEGTGLCPDGSDRNDCR